MQYKERLALALDLLDKSGMKRSSYWPPAYRLMSQLGVPVRPPHFCSFLANLVFMGSFFGLFWGGLMWFLVWRHQSLPPIAVAISGLGAGLLFGGLMAAIIGYGRRKHRLPDWSDITGPAAAFD